MSDISRHDIERAATAAFASSQNGVHRDTLQECLARTMGDVAYVQKDATNDFQRYKYASAEAVLKKVNASLSAQGVCCASTADLVFHESIPGAKRATFHAVVKLSLTFRKGSESVTVEGLGGGSDSGDKAVMKANTAALKYCLANAFLISWGDDPEADVETDKNAAPAKPSASRAKAAPKRSPGTPPIEGLQMRIEAHQSTKSLAEDRELVAELREVPTEAARTRLQQVWRAHEARLRKEEAEK